MGNGEVVMEKNDFAFRSDCDWHYIQSMYDVRVGKVYKAITRNIDSITFKNDDSKIRTLYADHFKYIVWLKEVKDTDFNKTIDSLFEDWNEGYVEIPRRINKIK